MLFRILKNNVVILPLVALVSVLCGCAGDSPVTKTTGKSTDNMGTQAYRESKIPLLRVKITPETDLLPPIMHSDEFEQPVPLPYPINTAGAEDSGFITPDGNTFYIFFTPDPNIPVQQQLDDGVTGIWVSQKVDGVWQDMGRVLLQDTNKQALDGCEFVQGNKMWFASARTGYSGICWFIADYINGGWTNWRDAGFDPGYEVGELDITADGKELYFHSARAGGKGNYDIWVSKKEDGKWLPPENIEILNSPEMEGWPSLTEDGNELWFTRIYLGSPAIFRSKKVNDNWQEPEIIISQFAGESSIDQEGNVYFTHHFYKDGVMLEADIYIAYRK
jgi:hypothetical protein